MPNSDADSGAPTAARGSLAMMVGQLAYFVLGYLVVVILARELGPVSYGIYGVLLSIVTWIEQSSRHAVNSVTVPAVATKGTTDAEHAAAQALTFNVALGLLSTLLLWTAAPRLASWLGLDGADWLIRIAAIDIPVFAAYTALEGVHQGRRQFYRISLALVLYATTKLVALLLLRSSGIEIVEALVVNVVASVAGVAALAPRAVRSVPMAAAGLGSIAKRAAPVGIYSMANLLTGSLALWVLEAQRSQTSDDTTGLFVAALNIVRVPAFTLAVLGAVLLPLVSRAVHDGDATRVRRYVQQAIRLFLILYLPACLILLLEPRALVEWIYSGRYTDASDLLAVLLVGQGFWTLQAILAWSLIAAASTWPLAFAMIAIAMLGFPMSLFLVDNARAFGASIAYGVMAVAATTSYGILIHRRFGIVWPARSLVRIPAAILAMAATSWITASIPLPWRALTSLFVYAATLVLSAEISRDDLRLFYRSEEAPR